MKTSSHEHPLTFQFIFLLKLRLLPLLVSVVFITKEILKMIKSMDGFIKTIYTEFMLHMIHHL